MTYKAALEKIYNKCQEQITKYHTRRASFDKHDLFYILRDIQAITVRANQKNQPKEIELNNKEICLKFDNYFIGADFGTDANCITLIQHKNNMAYMIDNLTNPSELPVFMLKKLIQSQEQEQQIKDLQNIVVGLEQKLKESTKLAHPDYVELQQLREFKKTLCQTSRRTATEIDQSVRIIELERKLEQLNCDGNCSNEKQKYKTALEKIIKIQGEEHICEQCMASCAYNNYCTTECEMGIAKQALGIEIKPYNPFKLNGGPY